MLINVCTCLGRDCPMMSSKELKSNHYSESIVDLIEVYGTVCSHLDN